MGDERTSSVGYPVGRWLRSAREQHESQRAIREMAAMLEVSAALLQADTTAGAVRSVVQVSFGHTRIPLVGLLPDRSGTGWFVAATRGMGVRRADVARAIEGVSALRVGRSTRSRLAARVGQVAGWERTEAIAAGDAVLLAADARADVRQFLQTAGTLLSEVLARLSAVDWARARNDDLDMALAWTAHELRGPLIGARAALGHVRTDDQEPRSQELLQQSRDELEQLADLVGPLLRWSAGPGSLRKRQTDLVRVVEEAVRSCCREFALAKVAVDGPEAILIMADASQLRGAIGNIVRNALIYAPDTAPVKVIVEADDVCARVRVRDRGPGVSAAERHLIFDPFARGSLASESRCGKGLGLFIAQRIVEAHGGSIGLRTARPGTEFCIELPLADGRRLRSAS